MSVWPFKHADFPHRVEPACNNLCREHVALHNAAPNAILKSLLFKQAVKDVHENISSESTIVQAVDIQEKIGWTLVCARALQRLNFERADHAAACYPQLACLDKDPNKSSSLLSPKALARHIAGVQNHAIDLAREDITQDISDLSRGRAEDRDSGDDYVRQKENIWTKLRRLSPGESLHLGCVQDDQGVLQNSPEDMARALVTHWKSVFSAASCDTALLHAWMSELFPHNGDGGWKTGIPKGDDPRWKVLRKHIRRAIRTAKSSMPGPDGVPAMAYKCAGELSVDILYAVLETLSSPNAEADLADAYRKMSQADAHAFNLSILCCLPKKPSGLDERGEFYYRADSTRPPNVGSMDNRLATSAVRMAWEPMLEQWISRMQRGFLKSRQMLHNVLDIDFEAIRISLEQDNGALILFDFRAAFSSVSHAFLQACLKALGFPETAMHFVSSCITATTD